MQKSLGARAAGPGVYAWPVPDAFDILGVEARFDLDAAAIQRAYLRRIKALHPDVAAAPDLDDAMVSAVNAARTALESPEHRAGVLLARLGGPSKEADRTLPDGFLVQMMEARESVDAAQATGDTHEVERWRAWAIAQRDGHMARAGALFERARGGADGALLRDIRRALNAWRYIERMLEQFDGRDGAP